MTPLRQRLIEDLQLRNRTPRRPLPDLRHAGEKDEGHKLGVKNRGFIEGTAFRLFENEPATTGAVGRCDRPGRMLLADASACAVPAELPGKIADQQPLICGVIDLKAAEDEIVWAIEAAPLEASAQSIPINRSAEAVWLLVCSSTNPMQSRIANAEVQFRYADGHEEKFELVPPLNFWSLSSWSGLDYNYETDAFALPPQPPPTVQLGRECRAMVLSWKLRPDVKLDAITLEALSQEIVVGLMGVSLMNPQ